MNKRMISCMKVLPLIAALTIYQTNVQAQRSSKPNIIFILTDDLGYGDLSSYGATKIHTPNMDALAQQGIRFTNAHATSSTCTPSRYSLMTGNTHFAKMEPAYCQVMRL